MLCRTMSQILCRRRVIMNRYCRAQLSKDMAAKQCSLALNERTITVRLRQLVEAPNNGLGTPSGTTKRRMCCQGNANLR